MKAVASHRARIADFATWRGLLVIAGTRPGAPADGHYFSSGPAGDGLWFGAVDDLYKLGAPGGEGGPWKETAVEAGATSDPFLMTNFGRKSLALSHDRDQPVTFAIEVDFLATGSWHQYAAVDVPAGEAVVHRFPDGFAAHWVRLRSRRLLRPQPRGSRTSRAELSDRLPAPTRLRSRYLSSRSKHSFQPSSSELCDSAEGKGPFRNVISVLVPFSFKLNVHSISLPGPSRCQTNVNARCSGRSTSSYVPCWG